MQRVKNVAVNVCIIALICMLLIWAETWHRQRAQIVKGEEALARGDYIAAISGFDSAIHMYTPGSPLVRKSAEKLWQMGEGLERRGDSQRALIAYRALRSSFYAVRGFSQPGRDWIVRCDAKIAALTANCERLKNN